MLSLSDLMRCDSMTFQPGGLDVPGLLGTGAGLLAGLLGVNVYSSYFERNLY